MPWNFLSPKFFGGKLVPSFSSPLVFKQHPTQKKKANKKEQEEEKDNDEEKEEAAAEEGVRGRDEAARKNDFDDRARAKRSYFQTIFSLSYVLLTFSFIHSLFLQKRHRVRVCATFKTGQILCR